VNHKDTKGTKVFTKESHFALRAERFHAFFVLSFAPFAPWRLKNDLHPIGLLAPPRAETLSPAAR